MFQNHLILGSVFHRHSSLWILQDTVLVSTFFKEFYPLVGQIVYCWNITTSWVHWLCSLVYMCWPYGIYMSTRLYNITSPKWCLLGRDIVRTCSLIHVPWINTSEYHGHSMVKCLLFDVMPTFWNLYSEHPTVIK